MIVNIRSNIEIMTKENVELDQFDKRILNFLQSDGRMTNARLAELTHLSAAACLTRVRRLTQAGFIRGFHADLDPAKLNAGLCIFIEVRLDRTTPTVFESFKREVMKRAEFQECHLVAGGFDYLIKVRVADMAAYRTLMGASIWTLKGVRETHTYAVMEEVKNTSMIPLPLAEGVQSRNGQTARNRQST
jgi:Lrp/AsnC family leucine-responsive transcriptional regulator